MLPLYLFNKLFKGTLDTIIGLGTGLNEQHVVFTSKFQTFFLGDFMGILGKYNCVINEIQINSFIVLLSK